MHASRRRRFEAFTTDDKIIRLNRLISRRVALFSGGGGGGAMAFFDCDCYVANNSLVN